MIGALGVTLKSNRKIKSFIPHYLFSVAIRQPFQESALTDLFSFHLKPQHVRNIAPREPVRKKATTRCLVGNLARWNPTEMRRWNIFPKHNQLFISVPLATWAWMIPTPSRSAKAVGLHMLKFFFSFFSPSEIISAIFSTRASLAQSPSGEHWGFFTVAAQQKNLILPVRPSISPTVCWSEDLCARTALMGTITEKKEPSGEISRDIHRRVMTENQKVKWHQERTDFWQRALLRRRNENSAFPRPSPTLYASDSERLLRPEAFCANTCAFRSHLERTISFFSSSKAQVRSIISSGGGRLKATLSCRHVCKTSRWVLHSFTPRTRETPSQLVVSLAPKSRPLSK